MLIIRQLKFLKAEGELFILCNLHLSLIRMFIRVR